MIPIIYKGEDKNILITVLTPSGEPVIISSLVDAVVSIYQTKNEIIQQFKLSDNSLQIVDDNAGKVQAGLDRDNTVNLQARRLYIEVKVVASGDFEANEQHIIVSDIILADLKNSV